MTNKAKLERYLDRLLKEAEEASTFEDKKRVFDMAFGAFTYEVIELNSVPDDFTAWNNFWECGYREKFIKAGCIKEE
jgi:hypothetical protein